MISLQSRIRFFLIFSLITYIITAISLFIINHSIGNQAVPQGSLNAGINLDRIFIVAIIMIILGFLVAAYNLLFTYIRGVNRYRELARRLHSLSDIGTFNLRSIEFPAEDEFGNIGKQLNAILGRLAEFDEIKTQRIKLERQKFTILAGILDIPVLFISLQGPHKLIKSYNNRFRELFTRKHKEEAFYEIEGSSLSALAEQCAPPAYKNYAPLIDENLLDAIDTSVNILSPATLKRDFTAMNGKEKYHCEKLEVIPIWDDYNQVGDILILFKDIRKNR